MGAENKRRGGESTARGQEGPGGSALPLSWATGVTLPKSYIYWEINTPRGGSPSDLPENTTGEGLLWPGLQYRPRAFLERKMEENAQGSGAF